MQIAETMLARQHYHFDEAAREAFRESLDPRMAQPEFANARSVRNAIDRIKLRQANRLYTSGGANGKEERARAGRHTLCR